jgi:CubicO group peptidase (beta-lactamase class C family)
MLTQPKPKTLRKFALPSLLLALLFSCITVPPAPPGEISGLGARLAERIEKLLIRDKERENIPAVSLAVMDQGEIIWLQSWGQTSLDLSRARPNSPSGLGVCRI